MNIRFFSNQCRYVDSIDFRNRWNPCSVYAANWVSHSTNQSQRSSFTNSYIMEQCEWRIDNFFSPALNIFCVNAPRYHLIGLMICIWKMQKAISHCLWFFAKFRHSWPFCRLEIEINNLKQLWWIFNWRATVNTIAADERSFFLLHIVRLMRAIFQRRFVSIFIVCWNFSVDIDDRFSFFLRFVRESVQMTRPDLVREVDDNVRKNFFFSRRPKSRQHSPCCWNRLKNYSRCHNVCRNFFLLHFSSCMDEMISFYWVSRISRYIMSSWEPTNAGVRSLHRFNNSWFCPNE